MVATVKKRCPNGSRRNKKTGLCVSKQDATQDTTQDATQNQDVTQDQNATQYSHPEQAEASNSRSGIQPPKITTKRKRCPNGSRRNAAGDCIKRTGVTQDTATQPTQNTVTQETATLPVQDPAVARKRIGRFMKTHRSKITARYLDHMCVRANECLAFGRVESSRIRTFFDGFTTFTYAASSIKYEKSNSVNGRVAVVPYKRESYTASALLKVATTVKSDNPYYEFTVGVFANTHLISRFPCFTETYGVVFLPIEVRDALASGLSVDPKDITLTSQKKESHMNRSPLADLVNNMDRIGYGCIVGERLGVLVQYFANFSSINEELKRQPWFILDNLHAILFQVYGPLAEVSDEFTHYDLHENNVLLVPAPHGKCFHMHYHLRGGRTVEFKTNVLVKIIDYGRCFFREPQPGGVSSTMMAEKVCANKLCDGDCGGLNGFWLDPSNPTSPFEIVSSRRNRTMDLILGGRVLQRLLKLFRKKGKEYDMVDRFMNSLPYNHLPLLEYELPEMPDVPGIINTVNSMSDHLVAELLSPAAMAANEKLHMSRAVHGQAHMFLDGSRRPMSWKLF